MELCLANVFFAFFIYLLMKNLLFYLALKYSRGQINGVLFLTFIVDVIVLFLFPILLLMTKGVC